MPVETYWRSACLLCLFIIRSLSLYQWALARKVIVCVHSGACLSIKFRMIELYCVIRAFTSQVLFVACRDESSTSLLKISMSIRRSLRHFIVSLEDLGFSIAMGHITAKRSDGMSEYVNIARG